MSGFGRSGWAAALVLVLAACGDSTPRGSSPAPAGLAKLDHFVVVYQENWSFDSLYPHFPGAENLDSPLARSTIGQVDKSGVPYPTLPQPLDSSRQFAPDPRFPANLPVAPFDASKYIPADQKTGDLVHRYYQEQLQIDNGKMDKFVAWSDAAGLVMSYYDAQDMPEGRLAQQYTMADHFFHAAYGGSFLNHFWLVCACSPLSADAPAGTRAQLDEAGGLVKDGAVTPDGFGINTAFTVNTPHPASAPAANLLPNQSSPTIGDRLSGKKISWAWYSGGWNDAVAGRPNPLFQFHHQPFAYFANYADGKPAKAEHLKDEADFFASLKNGDLPAVSFVKPLGPDNEHPGYASLSQGQQHVADVVRAVQSSRYWKTTAVIVTYDENGGRWDHVPPPRADRWGPGTRVPTIVISPFARKHFVDNTAYDTTSILATIEHRWGLEPLGTRDAAVHDLLNAFDFSARA